MSMQKGKCHICGVFDLLSFEHVPPREAFNSSPELMIPGTQLKKLIDSNYTPWNWKKARLRTQKMPRGIGYYSLCEKCNKTTGSYYAPSFIKVVKQGFLNLIDQNLLENIEEFSVIKLKFVDIDISACIKQIMAMLCSINSENFCDTYTDIREFILNKDSRGLNQKKFGLYMFLLAGSLQRYAGITAILDTNSGLTKLVSELHTPPYGFILEIDPKPFKGRQPLSMLELNQGKKINEKTSFSLSLPVFESNTQYPLDYRTKWEVIQARLGNGNSNE